MDEPYVRAVLRFFVHLYERGWIYRANRMVNWCPRCQTALSDIEVEHEDRNGKLWHIKYPYVSGNGHVIVATTRPETLLGDTAVAVNPEDERMRRFIETFEITDPRLLAAAVPVGVEGGGQVIRGFLEAGKLDVLEMAVLPLVLGDGIPLFPSGTDRKSVV